jgi:uncharacterized protein (UPF0335 family)
LNNLALVESQSLREQYIEKIEVLEKVKPLTILKDDTHVTVEMAANYYDVPVETVKSLIKNNNEELVLDGLRTLDGEQLRSFKDLCQIQSRVKALTIIPRRAVLRIGMLLRDSEVAKQIRSYLLNVESLTSDDIKNQAFDKLIEQNNVLTTEVQDLKDLFSTEITSLKDQIGILEKNSYFSRIKIPAVSLIVFLTITLRIKILVILVGLLMLYTKILKHFSRFHCLNLHHIKRMLVTTRNNLSLENMVLIL